tara:strand:- start:38753 stop:40279 length:1527 start_codon:yes stop_codon:yes gene_type:complete
MLKNNYIKRTIYLVLIIILFKPTWLINAENFGSAGDDLSYWIHSSTLAFDGDLNYKEDHFFESSIYDTETNAPYHSPGSGYAAAPFVKVFSYLDQQSQIGDIRINPVGSYALLGFLFSTLLFCFLGFYFFNKLIDFKQIKINKKILYLFIFAGTLVHYVSVRFLMAHAFEFFLVSVILYIFETKSELNKNNVFFLLLISYFLLAITRPSTFIYSLCLFGFYYKKFKIEKKSAVYNFFSISFFIFLYNYLANKLYNQNFFLLNLDENSTTSGLSSDINFKWILNGMLESFDLIFSPSMGVLWSIPVIIFGIICLSLNKIYLKNLDFIQKFSIFLYIFGCFLVLFVWQGREASFGQRLLIGIIPFCSYQVAQYFNTKNIKIIIPFLSITYLGSLFLYSSSNLTLQYGVTLWDTIIDWAGEDYFLTLASEMIKFENIASVFSRTIFFIDGVFLTNFFENGNIINTLDFERKSRFLNFIETYNNLEVTYFLLLNLILIYFSFCLEKLTRNSN